MIVVEALLALLVGAAALSLILLPILRPATAVAAPEWDLPELEETRKGQALLALKEIDFDLATGKLSDRDHALLKERFTAEAVAAMREDTSATASATAVASGPITCPACGPRPESDAIFCSNCGRPVGEAYCRGCGTVLTPGAKFCEGCGARAE